MSELTEDELKELAWQLFLRGGGGDDRSQWDEDNIMEHYLPTVKEVVRYARPVIESHVKKELLGRLGEALVDRLSDEQMILEIYAAVEGK